MAQFPPWPVIIESNFVGALQAIEGCSADLSACWYIIRETQDSLNAMQQVKLAKIAMTSNGVARGLAELGKSECNGCLPR